MTRLGKLAIAIVVAVAAFVCCPPPPAIAVYLDQGQEIRLGLRTYVGARVGTQDTSRKDFDVTLEGQPPRPSTTETFPYSASGHLRQNRVFTEVDLEHDILRLAREGFGPLALFNLLPFDLTRLRYHLTFRGEYEGVYDYGPSEYRTADQYITGPGSNPNVTIPDNPISGLSVNVLNARRKLRDIGSHRERLFQAFVDAEFGDLFIRFGRQNLSWGETDAFRLLDQINPLDSSFGGFLIPLDERRVPLDMLRVKYFLGTYGPFEEAFIEMYGAIDNKVSFDPGAAQGSAWTLPNLGKPSAAILNQTFSPSRTFTDIRGGGRLVWNMSIDNFVGTFSFAHYYTYFDNPTVEVTVRPGFPLTTFPNGYSSQTYLRPQRGQITGGTATFSIPYEFAQKLFLSGEPVIRTEFAFFRDEPRYRQQELDPFLFNSAQGQRCRGATAEPDCLANGRRTGDSVNFVLGIDHNQYLRFLNPNQTFFLSTQFFYKHLLHPATRRVNDRFPFVSDGEVLPVPDFITDGIISVGQPLQPIFVKNPTDQFLQTFLIATQYRSGTIVPAAALFYDWGGAWVFQPGITFIHDPFRFSVDYSFLTAGQLKGGSGVSLLRDRDNVNFRIEYTI